MQSGEDAGAAAAHSSKSGAGLAQAGGDDAGGAFEGDRWDDDEPDCFCCAIGLNVMKDPVGSASCVCVCVCVCLCVMCEPDAALEFGPPSFRCSLETGTRTKGCVWRSMCAARSAPRP